MLSGWAWRLVTTCQRRDNACRRKSTSPKYWPAGPAAWRWSAQPAPGQAAASLECFWCLECPSLAPVAPGSTSSSGIVNSNHQAACPPGVGTAGSSASRLQLEGRLLRASDIESQIQPIGALAASPLCKCSLQAEAVTTGAASKGNSEGRGDRRGTREEQLNGKHSSWDSSSHGVLGWYKGARGASGRRQRRRLSARQLSASRSLELLNLHTEQSSDS